MIVRWQDNDRRSRNRLVLRRGRPNVWTAVWERIRLDDLHPGSPSACTNTRIFSYEQPNKIRPVEFVVATFPPLFFSLIPSLYHSFFLSLFIFLYSSHTFPAFFLFFTIFLFQWQIFFHRYTSWVYIIILCISVFMARHLFILLPVKICY